MQLCCVSLTRGWTGGFLSVPRSWRTSLRPWTLTATDSSPSTSSPLASVCLRVVSASGTAVFDSNPPPTAGSFFQVTFYLARTFLERKGAKWKRRQRVKPRQKSCTRPSGRTSWDNRMRMKRRNTSPCSWKAWEATASLKSEQFVCVCVWSCCSGGIISTESVLGQTSGLRLLSAV